MTSSIEGSEKMLNDFVKRDKDVCRPEWLKPGWGLARTRAGGGLEFTVKRPRRNTVLGAEEFEPRIVLSSAPTFAANWLTISQAGESSGSATALIFQDKGIFSGETLDNLVGSEMNSEASSTRWSALGVPAWMAEDDDMPSGEWADQNAVVRLTSATPTTAMVESVWSSVDMAKVGQPIRLAASVSPASAQGIVSFFANDAKLGQASVFNGVATLTLDDLPAGQYRLSATFQGANGYASSASLPLSQEVQAASLSPTITEMFTDNSPSEIGDRVTFSAFVRKATLGGIGTSGTVSFYAGGRFLGSSDVIGGLATVTVSNLDIGKHRITAKFNGGGEFAASVSSPIFQNVLPPQAKRTFVEVFSDGSPSQQGKVTTFTAYVSTGQNEGVGAKGTVTFLSQGQDLGTVQVSDSVARLRVDSLRPGENKVTAKFNGAGDLQPSVSPTIVQKVEAAKPVPDPGPQTKATTTVLRSSNVVYPPGVSVPLTATVYQGGKPIGNGGFVEFFANGRLLGIAPVISGDAVLDTNQLAVGSHSISAYFSGDREFEASLSAPATVQIRQDAKVSTFSWLWVRKDPNSANGPNSFIIRSFVSDRHATGAVQLYDGNRLLGAASLSEGIAEFRTNLAPGSHSLKAVYVGDSKYAGSESLAFQRTV